MLRLTLYTILGAYFLLGGCYWQSYGITLDFDGLSSIVNYILSRGK